MNRRKFRLCPPSFPEDYDYEEQEAGHVYQSMYTSVGSIFPIPVGGANEWSEYAGDIISGVSEDVEVLECTKLAALRSITRWEGRGLGSRVFRVEVPTRHNQM